MKPVYVTVEQVTIPIYWSPVNGYDRWELRYRAGGQTVRRKFADIEEAKKEANDIALRMSNGEADPRRLTPEDAGELFRARMILDGGASLVDAAQTHHTLAAELPGVNVEQLIQCWRRHNTTADAPKVQAAVDEMLAWKRKDGLKAITVDGYKSRLNRFAAAFGVLVTDLTGPAVDAWIQGATKSPTSFSNMLRVIRTFCTWCQRRSYLPKDWDELDLIESPEDAGGPIEVYSPDQLRTLLETAAARHRAALAPLALGSFAGVRTGEITRMDWSDISDDLVTVGSQKVRGAGRRHVPTQPALLAWIAGRRKTEGSIRPTKELKLFRLVSKSAGIAWKSNALRHSYISYRLALVKNAAQVAEESGNSVGVIRRHYQRLVTPEDAQKWFSIFPNQSPKMEHGENEKQEIIEP